MKPLLATAAIVAALPCLAFAQQEPDDTTRMEWLPRPSLRIGDVFRMDLRVKLHADWRRFPDELEPEEGTFAFARRRLGIEGTLARQVEYEVEYDFEGGGIWTDVFANVRSFRNAQVKAGKFKVPFGLDQLTSVTNLDFIYRTAIGRDLSPGRDIGVMLHGRVLDQSLALGYDAGVFRHDGDRSKFGENPGAGPTIAGRVTLQPFRSRPKEAPLRQLEVGVQATGGDVAEGPGPNSLRARAVGEELLFYEVYVKGRRTRLGTHAAWEPGPFSLKGEFVHIWDSRNAQGILGDDLAPVEYGGWYVSGTWVLTGEQKSGGVEPRNPFLHGGLGAIEVAARYERVGFGSEDPSADPEANPRAANLVETGSGAFTAGVNWYLNRWVRFQFNAIRESFDDLSRSPVAGQSSFWSGLCRVQFVI